ncbi:hypothetical protein HQ545_00965 [Candidatus Woesearchaeota archaeon]|nr:hypothetical protein [Candidatus Woesearchaeota archaeon]
MFDSLSIEKRRILLEYPFARAFAAEKLDFETFLDNINEFKPDLIKKGFTDSDFETLSIIKKVHDRQTDMKEGLEILKKYNFPIDQDKKFAYFLATHSEDLQSMAKAAGKNVVSMFQYGLPEINSMLEKEIITWPQIVNGLPEMANQSRENTDYMFNTDCMFKFGIPQFNRLLEKKIITWPQMVKDLPLMTKATGPNAWRLFFHGIPAIKNLITKENWPHIVELTKTSGHGTNDLFQYGLPVIKEILTEENWPHIIELTKAVGEDTAYLFQVGLIEIKDILTEENWPYIIKIAKATGKHTNYVFYHGLANVKHLIDESNLRNFVDFFVYVGISNQRIMKMMRIFNVLEPRTDPLLLYLIMFKPKLVLNILQNVICWNSYRSILIRNWIFF